MYEPFGYTSIPEHLQGYRILAKHIADLFPGPPWELWTKEQRRLKYKMCINDFTYSDYYGPFK